MKKQNVQSPGTFTKINRVLSSGRKRYTKKTFIKIFTYSSIIALMVLVVSTIIQYNAFREIVRQETYRKSLDLLNQTKSIFSSIHSWLIPYFYRINSESPVNYLINTEKAEKIRVAQGIERMDQILASFNLFHSIYIYNNNTEEYYSTINGFEGKECSDFDLPNILHNIDKFGVYKYIPRKMNFRIRDNVFRRDFKKLDQLNVFSVVVGNPPVSGNIIKGALIINVSEDKIRSSLLSVNPQAESELIIINSRGKVLSHQNKEKFGEDFSGYSYIKKIMSDTNGQGVFTQEIDRSKYLVSFVNHPYWEWTFINLTPYEKIFSSLDNFLNKTIMALVLLIVLTLTLAYIASLRIYSPIHDFFLYSQNLKENLRIENPAGVKRLSELQYLDRIFKTMVKKADAYENNIQKHEKIHRQENLKALLTGDMDIQELENYDETLFAELQSGPYFLAVLQLDNYEYLSKIHTTEDLTQFFNIIRELIYHYSDTKKIFYIPLKNDHVCIIYNLGSQDDKTINAMKEIKNNFKIIQDAAKEKLCYSFTLGLSDIFSDNNLFQEKYNMALDATLFRFRFGNHSIISITDINKAAEKNYIFPEEKLKRLLNDLKLGRLPDLNQNLDDMLLEITKYDYEDYIYMLHCISYHTNKTVDKLKNKLGNSFSTCKSLIQEIKTTQTLDALKKTLSETYQMIYETMQSNQTSKTADLALRIKEYIHKYYRDPSLCTDSLAEVMGVSAYYIRFVFKNYFGLSVSEFINNIRLEYCRDQLVNTRQTIKKIYKNAGFYNYSYFFTLFKKNTGLTPNQYRTQKTAP